MKDEHAKNSSFILHHSSLLVAPRNQIDDRECEERNRQPDREFEDHLLGTAALYVQRAATTEGSGETRDPVLHKNADDQENRDGNEDGGDDSGHRTSL